MPNGETPPPLTGSAADLMAGMKDKFAGATQRSPENFAKAQQAIANSAGVDHMQEAALFTEETIKWMNTEWNAREFSVEQRIFALALAYQNFRHNFPEAKGGKEKFDEVAKTAWEYFNANR